MPSVPPLNAQDHFGPGNSVHWYGIVGVTAEALRLHVATSQHATGIGFGVPAVAITDPPGGTAIAGVPARSTKQLARTARRREEKILSSGRIDPDSRKGVEVVCRTCLNLVIADGYATTTCLNVGSQLPNCSSRNFPKP
ncbi:MAG: hypothetical protein C0467_27765 [Planctomycetaceae bacterium]|nr:hypothetical protein [Planctomycetaceae bacterium]